MKRITKIEENESVGTTKKIQVAAYCRVSTLCLARGGNDAIMKDIVCES